MHRPCGAFGLHVGKTTVSESQYFVDAASKELARSDGQVQQATSVYTTLDLRLQHAAEQAIADGMQLVDKQLASRNRSSASASPQVALIAIDPHTGQVKALMAAETTLPASWIAMFAKRPPGSVFKPFVYTAALNTAVTGGDPVLTPMSIVDDSPTTFDSGARLIVPLTSGTSLWDKSRCARPWRIRSTWRR